MLEKKNPLDMYRSTQSALPGHSQQPTWVGENGAQFPRSRLEPHPLQGPPHQLPSPPFPTSTGIPQPSSDSGASACSLGSTCPQKSSNT